MSNTMPSYIPEQYHNPRYIQVDPDNKDPDVYDVETGMIINSKTGEIVGSADPGQKNYDGSKTDLTNVSYKKKDIESDASQVTDFLDKQIEGLNGKIKDLTQQLLSAQDRQDPNAGAIQEELTKLKNLRSELWEKNENIKNAKTPSEKTKAIEAALQTSLEADKSLAPPAGGGGSNPPAPNPPGPNPPGPAPLAPPEGEEWSTDPMVRKGQEWRAKHPNALGIKGGGPKMDPKMAANLLYDGDFGHHKGGVMARIREVTGGDDFVSRQDLADILADKGKSDRFSESELAAIAYLVENKFAFDAIDSATDGEVDGVIDFGDYNAEPGDGDLANYLEENATLWGDSTKNKAPEYVTSDRYNK
ncbi:hypothetical protein ACFQUU_27365 [Herbaspirillum sp. GCM10030257]|uniref:hypothetical protein n=1 Tax=Herbaspirillum sp. GCM10030257 TaxID=3273393 RepID=UPI0036090CB8